MEKLKRKDTTGRAVVLFMSFHAMLTGLLLVAMVHTQIRIGKMTQHIAKQAGEIGTLREMLNEHILMESSSIEQKSVVKSKGQEAFRYNIMESKVSCS